MNRDVGTAVPEGQDPITPGGNMMSLRRERTLIVALLLILTTASWSILIWQSSTVNGMGMGLTMGMGAAFFLAIWVVMMIAMMFPSAVPMILAFAHTQRGRHSSDGIFTPIWIFVVGYLLIWALFGGLSYLGALASSWLAQQVPWITMNAAQIGGGILVLAGLYQLTPLKRACLAKCRAPQGFILHCWRDGFPGFFRMGLEHGISCLGCNWLLFLLLFPVGIMNIAAMVLLTALIFVEKVFPVGARIAQFAAPFLILYGALVIVARASLPLSGMGM